MSFDISNPESASRTPPTYSSQPSFVEDRVPAPSRVRSRSDSNASLPREVGILSTGNSRGERLPAKGTHTKVSEYVGT